MLHGFMIASHRSGAGKTTVTLGLLRALRRRGLKVASFKCGPDYIDPAFHQIATGRASYNLDSWTMPQAVLQNNFTRGALGADIILAEGSMGLFDGVATVGASGDGASADIATLFNLTVVLVLDVSGQSQSAGAVAAGFRDFHPDVKIAGVILGNVASKRHFDLAKLGVERAGMVVFGALPRGAVPPLPERHLGLVQAAETPDVSDLIDKLADVIEQHIDIDMILGEVPLLSLSHNPKILSLEPPVKHIALAKDVAFSFIYPHIIADWQERGIEILPFSPLANEAPNPAADICWLAGGYPELHVEQLSKNQIFLQGLRDFAKNKPVHGECGGYMVLGEVIIDANGKEWKMAGLLPLTTSFANKKLHLGYRSVRLAVDCLLGAKNSQVRGHEFHYASIVKQEVANSLGEMSDANGVCLGSAGMQLGKVTGSFFHLMASE
jgi:cobyrinic acid a,c-diamide synthase